MTTVQDLADFFAWQCQIGKGAHLARLCPRGLDMRTAKDTAMSLVVPDAGEMYDDANNVVFLRAVF